MAEAVTAAEPVRISRPANHTRSLFHVLSGLGTILLIELLLDPMGMFWVAGVFMVAGWTLEAGRRLHPIVQRFCMFLFGKVAHEHERHTVNSATWYVTALFLLALTGSKLAASIGVAVLAFGDPAAAYVGRAIGRIKLVQKRTLEGSLAFVVAGGAAAFLIVRLFHPDVPAPAALGVSLAAAMVGALAELFAKRLDDNLLVPLAAACTALAIYA